MGEEVAQTKPFANADLTLASRKTLANVSRRTS